MKRYFATLLALCLLLCMCAPGYAANNPPTLRGTLRDDGSAATNALPTLRGTRSDEAGASETADDLPALQGTQSDEAIETADDLSALQGTQSDAASVTADDLPSLRDTQSGETSDTADDLPALRDAQSDEAGETADDLPVLRDTGSAEAGASETADALPVLRNPQSGSDNSADPYTQTGTDNVILDNDNVFFSITEVYYTASDEGISLCVETLLRNKTDLTIMAWARDACVNGEELRDSVDIGSDCSYVHDFLPHTEYEGIRFEFDAQDIGESELLLSAETLRVEFRFTDNSEEYNDLFSVETEIYGLRYLMGEECLPEYIQCASQYDDPQVETDGTTVRLYSLLKENSLDFADMVHLYWGFDVTVEAEDRRIYVVYFRINQMPTGADTHISTSVNGARRTGNYQLSHLLSCDSYSDTYGPYWELAAKCGTYEIEYVVCVCDDDRRILHLTPVTLSYETVTGMTVHPDYETLQRGSTGDIVEDLQRRLIALGFLNGTADGVYGAKTAAAVRNFRSYVGMSASDVADSATQSMLFNEIGYYVSY